MIFFTKKQANFFNISLHLRELKAWISRTTNSIKYSLLSKIITS